MLGSSLVVIGQRSTHTHTHTHIGLFKALSAHHTPVMQQHNIGRRHLTIYKGSNNFEVSEIITLKLYA